MNRVIYRNVDNEYELCSIEVEKLNELYGVDNYHLQVLKSAAGYYIGTLCKADWHPDFWEPYMRDSEIYWPIREQAEEALLSYDYPIKF